MAIWKLRSKRKASGGKYKKARDKKKREIGREPALTILGERRVKKIRTRNAGSKTFQLSNNIANVLDIKTKKFRKVKIKTVTDNTANRNYIRRNILTKGAIIDTEIGRVKITNRPGQEGAINAVLVPDK